MFTLRLGTRRSSLALTQSNWVKARLEALHPKVRVELVGIDTQGDEIHQNQFSTKPLQTLDGKNFFVKELDEALLAHKTDFSVHSYKDLSLDRPEELIIAAVPERENPRDIVLFHPSIHEKLATGTALTLGSASPRRMQNTPELLKTLLPQCRSALEMKPLRGNVTTRLRKLTEGEFDGIVLALAGLNRLNADIGAFPKMILPLDQCPTAPAQGALAIECRRDDTNTQQLLAALHHPQTAFHIERERIVLHQYGGGCHQAFGATSIDLAPNKPLTFIRGQSDAGQLLDELQWTAPLYSGNITVWDGIARRHSSQTVSLTSYPLPKTSNIFITHYRAAIPLLPRLKNKRLWASGITSWQKLAEQGLWIEGSAEGLGIAHIQDMLGDLQEWTVVTHEAALEEWKNTASAIATYRVEPSPQEAEGLAEATHVYWGSGSQFMRLRHLANQAKHHASGAGKTADTLRSHQIEPDIFPSVAEWRKAVGKNV